MVTLGNKVGQVALAACMQNSQIRKRLQGGYQTPDYQTFCHLAVYVACTFQADLGEPRTLSSLL